MDDTDPMPATTGTDHPTAASTSSTPPDTSPPADLIAELGEHILTELGADRTNRTLTRWLAHHIARLVNAADRARTTEAPDADTRAAEAHTAILQLWQHRSAWPHGWPPPRAATIARLLDLLPDLDNSQWHQATRFSRLHDLHHRVLATICDLATADEENLEQGWLDKFGELLTPDEITLLTRAATVPQRLDQLVQWWDESTIQETDTNQAADSPSTNAASPSDNQPGQPPEHPLIALANAYREAILDLLSDTTRKSDDITDVGKKTDED